ncbi:MAG TPA: heme o synthase [Phycisphaerales bacterium]|nr:heme o synthase [Phycisphaerales bacterium]HMP38343.1 heme o synthase [Phycisphaerales bacterium]
MRASLGRRLADVGELTKSRLVAMVLVTTAVGFILASRGPIEWWTLVLTIVGTGLAAASAMALNQLVELERDARMDRTCRRPLPDRRVSPHSAILLAGACGLAGTALLLLAVHPLAAILAGLNVILYAFVYTPLKARTTLNTLVGAVSGAIPPMIGWAAATGSLSLGAWLLGAILVLWQLPHFLALAWLYREDYRRGGFVMLPEIDPRGRLTAVVSLFASMALVPLSLMAVLAGLAGPAYVAGAILLGAGFVVLAARLVVDRSDRSARLLFVGSLVYLPLLLGLLVLDHERGKQRLRAATAEAATALVAGEPK